MAEVVNIIQPPAPPAPEKVYTVSLTQTELNLIANVLGHIGGSGVYRPIADEIWGKLKPHRTMTEDPFLTNSDLGVSAVFRR